MARQPNDNFEAIRDRSFKFRGIDPSLVRVQFKYEPPATKTSAPRKTICTLEKRQNTEEKWAEALLIGIGESKVNRDCGDHFNGPTGRKIAFKRALQKASRMGHLPGRPEDHD